VPFMANGVLDPTAQTYIRFGFGVQWGTEKIGEEIQITLCRYLTAMIWHLCIKTAKPLK